MVITMSLAEVKQYMVGANFVGGGGERSKPIHIALGVWEKQDYDDVLGGDYPDADPLTDHEIEWIVADLEEAMNGAVIFPTLHHSIEQIMKARENKNV